MNVAAARDEIDADLRWAFVSQKIPHEASLCDALICAAALPEDDPRRQVADQALVLLRAGDFTYPIARATYAITSSLWPRVGWYTVAKKLLRYRRYTRRHVRRWLWMSKDSGVPSDIPRLVRSLKAATAARILRSGFEEAISDLIAGEDPREVAAKVRRLVA